MKIFSGTSNPALAQKIAEELKIPLGKLEIFTFADGEKRIRILDKVLEEDCIVVQPTSPPADSNYMELFFIIDGLKRSGARSITAVIPYLGYQRQDHVFRDGEAVSLEVVVETLQSTGVSKIICFDLHSIKIPELFRLPLVHLSALPLFAEKIKELARGPATRFPPASARSQNTDMRAVGNPSSPVTSNLAREGASSAYTLEANSYVLISPDMGGIRRIKELSELLGNMPYAVIDKDRNLSTDEVEAVDLSGDVKGKTAIMVDDMISTGKTMVVGSKLLLEKGAKRVLVFATHPVFSDDSKETLENSPIGKVVVCDTISVPKEKQFKKLEILSIAKLVAGSLK